MFWTRKHSQSWSGVELSSNSDIDNKSNPDLVLLRMLSEYTFGRSATDNK